MITRHAERKAALLTRADEFDAQGRGEVADELRQRAETLTWDKPLDISVPAIMMADRDPILMLAEPTKSVSRMTSANGIPASTSKRARRRRA